MSDQNRDTLSDQQKVDRAAWHEEVRFLKKQQWLSQLRGPFFQARSLRLSTITT